MRTPRDGSIFLTGRDVASHHAGHCPTSPDGGARAAKCTNSTALESLLRRAGRAIHPPSEERQNTTASVQASGVKNVSTEVDATQLRSPTRRPTDLVGTTSPEVVFGAASVEADGGDNVSDAGDLSVGVSGGTRIREVVASFAWIACWLL